MKPVPWEYLVLQHYQLSMLNVPVSVYTLLIKVFWIYYN